MSPVAARLLGVGLVCWLLPRRLIFSLQRCKRKNLDEHPTLIIPYSEINKINEHITTQVFSPAPQRSSCRAAQSCEGG